jgi:arylsulfatase A-like enzyme
MAKTKHGSVSDKFTLSVDLAPTLLGAAGIAPSNFMQGRDIADIYLKPDAKWRRDFFYEYNRGHPITGEGHEGTNWIDASFALVTKEWKYVYWPEHRYEQLFDRINDPFEETDIMRNKTTLKSTDEIYFKMKARYNFLKHWAQSGKRV